MAQKTEPGIVSTVPTQSAALLTELRGLIESARQHVKRLVAVELTLERVQPAHKGQMELYLRWRAQHDRAAGEEPPIGLILCASKDAEQVVWTSGVRFLAVAAWHLSVSSGVCTTAK